MWSNNTTYSNIEEVKYKFFKISNGHENVDLNINSIIHTDN